MLEIHLQLQISFSFQSLLHSESGYRKGTSGSTHLYIMSHYKSSHRLFLKQFNISLRNNNVEKERKVTNTLSLNESQTLHVTVTIILTQNFEAKSAFLLASKFLLPLQ